MKTLTIRIKKKCPFCNGPMILGQHLIDGVPSGYCINFGKCPDWGLSKKLEKETKRLKRSIRNNKRSLLKESSCENDKLRCYP